MTAPGLKYQTDILDH